MIRVVNLSKDQSRTSPCLRPRAALVVGCLLVFLVFAHGAQAQVSASISGRVTDQTSAVVSGATVAAKNLETGAVRTAVTDDAGRYAILALAVGEYEVRITKQNFQEAVKLLPRSPDPHLGLARIYVYSVKNMGNAMAELEEAQQLGFHPGPREREEEADGYRFRASTELAEARKAHGTSSAAEERYLRLARRDFELARELYEPLQGFSNVSLALRQVDDDDRARQELNDALKTDASKKATPKKPQRKAVRRTRWQ